MPVTEPFRQLVQTIRTQAGTLLERSQNETSEQIAQFSGRAASWAEQAGVAIGQISEEAAAALGSLGHGAADRAERYAQQAGERLAQGAGRAAHGLSELALRAGENLTETPPRD